MAVTAARSETAAFPKYESVFTVTVPEDFRVELKNNEMWIKPKDADDIASFVFRELPASDVHDSDSARSYLRPYVDGQCIRWVSLTAN